MPNENEAMPREAETGKSENIVDQNIVDDAQLLREAIEKLPGLKRKDIQKCAVCGEGVMHSGYLTFYRLNVERFVVDIKAIQRRHGMEQFFGGGSAGAALAGVMGTDDDLAKRVMQPVNVLVCEFCINHENLIDRIS